MSEKNQQKEKSSNQRKFYTVLPLLILLLAFLIINWLTPNQRRDEVVLLQTAVSQPQPTLSNTRTRPPILPATILPTLTPTPLPLLSLPSSASITLIGPPDNSRLSKNGPVSFYWAYSEQLQSGQQFVFILLQNKQEIIRRVSTEANLGSGFQFQINLQETIVEPGTAVWQIGLQWIDEEEWLIASPQRNLTIMSQ